MAQERHPDPALYSMLVGALARAGRRAGRPDAVAPSFFLKALVLEGAGPGPRRVRRLRRARRRRGAGGLRPRRRRHAVPGPPQRPPHEPGRARRCCAASSAADLAAVLAGPPPPAADEVAELATEAMEAHLDRRIRSVRSTAGL